SSLLVFRYCKTSPSPHSLSPSHPLLHLSPSHFLPPYICLLEVGLRVCPGRGERLDLRGHVGDGSARVPSSSSSPSPSPSPALPSQSEVLDSLSEQVDFCVDVTLCLRHCDLKQRQRRF